MAEEKRDSLEDPQGGEPAGAESSTPEGNQTSDNEKRLQELEKRLADTQAKLTEIAQEKEFYKTQLEQSFGQQPAQPATSSSEPTFEEKMKELKELAEVDPARAIEEANRFWSQQLTEREKRLLTEVQQYITIDKEVEKYKASLKDQHPDLAPFEKEIEEKAISLLQTGRYRDWKHAADEAVKIFKEKVQKMKEEVAQKAQPSVSGTQGESEAGTTPPTSAEEKQEETYEEYLARRRAEKAKRLQTLK
ncbi:MAG: hypothetical protein DRP75_04345 [Candidatus Omnitrophota bacterium]|nr:MAG: hypothetical protein DRP75_04345 [Candidatus Omnitrophota bacterium]RLC40264.1 MAG: hypothetical protein DRH51_05870 [Candidatus Coatesbacteria bacterium]